MAEGASPIAAKIAFMRCVRLPREVELYNAVWMPNIISGIFQREHFPRRDGEHSTKCDRRHD